MSLQNKRQKKGKMEQQLEKFEKIIGYKFKDKKLLITALTHSSYKNENHHIEEHNERLEFLGDSVIELCVSEELLKRFQDAREGELTSTRAYLVNESSLATLARKIKLNQFILLGKGEEAQGGRERDANLCDALEALVGAIFLDGGYLKAKKFVLFLFKEMWPSKCIEKVKKDYKSHLQEITQKLYKERPKYIVLDSFGPEHAKSYRVQVILPNNESYEAVGTSIKGAEQLAAKKAIENCSKDKI